MFTNKIFCLTVVLGCVALLAGQTAYADSALYSSRWQELKPEQLYKKALPSIMTLKVEGKKGPSLGTAFFVYKDGIAVTAWHVVKNAKRVTAKFSNGEEFAVSGVIDKNEERDLALIQVDCAGKPFLKLLRSAPEVGSKAYVIGAPQGLDFSITDGLISQIQDFEGLKQYQFSCPASAGNSGGPLLNPKGEVIGIVSWQIRDSQNLNFAIPAFYATNLQESYSVLTWNKLPPETDPQKPTPPKPAIEKEDTQEHMAYVIGKCLGDMLDWHAMSKYLVAHVVGNTRYVFHQLTLEKATRMPARLTARLDELDKIKTTDATFGNLIDTFRKNLRLQITECRCVLQSNTLGIIGRYSEMDVQLREARAAEQEMESFNVSDVKQLKTMAGFRNGLPSLYQRNWGIKRDIINVNLEYTTWSQDELDVLDVERDGLAEKMGIRPGDRLSSVNGFPIHSAEAFKLQLSLFAGRRTTIGVMRGVRHQEFEVDIPENVRR